MYLSGYSFELSGKHALKRQCVACVGDYRLFESSREQHGRALLSKAVGKATCVDVGDAS